MYNKRHKINIYSVWITLSMRTCQIVWSAVPLSERSEIFRAMIAFTTYFAHLPRIFTSHLPNIVYPGCLHKNTTKSINVEKEHTHVPRACNCQDIPVLSQIFSNLNQSFFAPWTTFPQGFVQIDSYVENPANRQTDGKRQKTDNKTNISHLWSREGICRCTVEGMMADLL